MKDLTEMGEIICASDIPGGRAAWQLCLAGGDQNSGSGHYVDCPGHLY
jgi:hypothetical protein